MTIEQISSGPETLARLCSGAKKWGLYFSINWKVTYYDNPPLEKYLPELLKAMNIFKTIEEWNLQLAFDNCGYFLFDTEKQMVDAYNSCVGDDGPTTKNPTGSDYLTVYALTCSPDGQCLNENT